MSSPTHPIVELLKQDQRYHIEAYQFLRDSLSYAQEVLHLGAGSSDDSETAEEWSSEEGPPHQENHITGQDLCEAIRQYAIDQFGYMAKVVLENWGVRTTDDFGEIVYNLIRVGLMRQSEDDQLEDFHACYNFDEVFMQRFEISDAGS